MTAMRGSIGCNNQLCVTNVMDEWRAYKRAVRRLKYVQRMQQGKEADPAAFLEAVRRDDAGDPYQEQPHALEATA